MREYTFRIVWEGGYAPSCLTSTYSDQYSRLTSYEIKVLDTSCKSAISRATAFINHRTNNIQAFKIIPK